MKKYCLQKENGQKPYINGIKAFKIIEIKKSESIHFVTATLSALEFWFGKDHSVDKKTEIL